MLEQKIAESGGEVVQKTGDGFFATFATPKAALEAAIAIQRALEAEIVAPDVRIGAHTGDAFENVGDANAYGGEAVHLASRVGAAAGAGEILTSRETLEGAGSDFRTSNPRSETFKGFAEPVEVVNVDWRWYARRQARRPSSAAPPLAEARTSQPEPGFARREAHKHRIPSEAEITSGGS